MSFQGNLEEFPDTPGTVFSGPKDVVEWFYDRKLFERETRNLFPDLRKKKKKKGK